MSKKLTIIKVMGVYGRVTPDDIDKWRDIFANHKMTEEEALATGEVEITHIPRPEEGEDEHYITLVRVGNKSYSPTADDLKAWRDVFEDAQKDPDFKIFTHPDVDISVIKLGDIIAVK